MFLSFTVLLMLVSFAVASIILVRTYVEPVDNVNPSLALLHTTTAEAAAFGDSRIAFDYAGSVSIVNLAYPGESVADMAARVERWLRNQPHPSLAIVEADPHLLSVYRSGNDIKTYLSGEPSGWIAALLPIDDRHRPLLTTYWRRFLFEGGIKSSKFSFQPNGWQINSDRFEALPAVERLIWARGRVQQQEPAPGFSMSDAAKRYRQILQMLERAGARICLVTTPVSAPYASLAAERPRFQEARTFFAALAREGGYRYLDLSHSFANEAQIGLFADSDHLNERGAPQFTAMVNKGCEGQA